MIDECPMTFGGSIAGVSCEIIEETKGDVGPMEVIRELGWQGLYKGSSMCLARDIPFSAIYFPSFAYLKDYFADPITGHTSAIFLLLAGAVAGIPAAYMTTPMDVIKTRLQVVPGEGHEHYKGPADCFDKIVRDEGPGALFKGGLQRVVRSSPQFAVTLMVFSLLNGG
mmetsp:Transcript_10153/g.32875  ORF Transcript_10153/g.32875 Transcript_10153/m.32875 type:complete len:168 (-) Transcript_10153:212-715(-)